MITFKFTKLDVVLLDSSTNSRLSGSFKCMQYTSSFGVHPCSIRNVLPCVCFNVFLFFLLYPSLLFEIYLRVYISIACQEVKNFRRAQTNKRPK